MKHNFEKLIKQHTKTIKELEEIMNNPISAHLRHTFELRVERLRGMVIAYRIALKDLKTGE